MLRIFKKVDDSQFCFHPSDLGSFKCFFFKIVNPHLLTRIFKAQKHYPLLQSLFKCHRFMLLQSK